MKNFDILIHHLAKRKYDLGQDDQIFLGDVLEEVTYKHSIYSDFEWYESIVTLWSESGFRKSLQSIVQDLKSGKAQELLDLLYELIQPEDYD